VSTPATELEHPHPPAVGPIAEAVSAGRLPGRVWMYTNYHCNIACTYCLTESHPGAARRELDPAAMLDIAAQARDLGFTDLGVTGGEPFLQPFMPDLLAELAQQLPVVTLTNATLFSRRLLARVEVLAGLPVALQISLDRPDADTNDAMRVELDRLCALHRDLGVPDSEHIIRPIVHRGRAINNDLGVHATVPDLPAELTITADGAFYSPFGPTVHNGQLDTDLLLTRTTRPLATPARAQLGLIEDRLEGEDSTLNIR